MPKNTTYILDLRETVRALLTDLPHPNEIWMFGSRAQRTGSKRSDVDLLIIDRGANMTNAELVEWLHGVKEERDPLDLFISNDGRIAHSVVNGSRVKDDENLPELLGGILLWSKTSGLSADPSVPWIQEFRVGVDFKKTIIPTDFSAALAQLPAELDRLGLPNTLMGTDWGSIARRCVEILASTIDAMGRLNVRAANLTRDSAYPRDEYDAQNLFFLTMRSWLPDLEWNPFEIRYAGQQKFADFAGARSQVVVEVKFVKDNDSRAAIVKQLGELTDLYSQPPNTKVIIFAIVVADGVEWDSPSIDSRHSYLDRHPIVVTHSFSLPKASR